MKTRFETPGTRETKNLIKSVFDYAAEHFALPLKTEVSVSFLTESEIREVNRSSRNTDAVTDVLSFPYLEGIKGKAIKVSDYKTDVDPYTKCLMLGEINICLEKAKQQAEEYGHSVTRECAYLALHGLLHILGYDHIKDEDKKEMREREEKILSALAIERV